MSDKSAIEWTDATWNPVTGCTKVSPGCASCYIERTPAFRMTGQRFVDGKIPVQLHPDRLEEPLHWRKPRRVFVVSMGDLFHEDVPADFIGMVFAIMSVAETHTFQVLTKRPERMRRLLSDPDWYGGLTHGRCVRRPGGAFEHYAVWPLPNVWCGVSVENQRMAEERIPRLLETPAAVRFLSCEPLLGPLDLVPWPSEPAGLTRLRPYYQGSGGTFQVPPTDVNPPPFIDWVIVGGESGPGRAERKLVVRCECRGIGIKQRHGSNMGDYFPGPSRPDSYRRPNCMLCAGIGWRPKPQALEWLRSLRDQCQAAGVPFFFKQWGGPKPKSGGRLLDGRKWNEMPQREVVLA